MFLGHFALAFAARRLAPRTSLGTLVFAAQFADLLWPVLLLAGIEQAQVLPDATVATPLLFAHYPWSHSLLALAFAGAVVGGIHVLRRHRLREALVLGLLVPGHWLLDWLVHAPDLPLTPAVASSRHGLGAWHSMGATLALELGLFTAGAALYVRGTRPLDRTGTLALAALLAFLGVVFAASLFGAPPPGIRVVAWAGLSQWLLVAWAAWVDRHRNLRGDIA